MEEQPDLSTVKLVEEVFKPTVGLNSSVMMFPSDNGDESHCIGHIIQMDIERDVIDIDEALQTLRKHEGVFFVLKSSENCYHVYNPVVKSLYGVYDFLNNLNNNVSGLDQDFVDVGLKKGKYTLRVAEKGDKPRPEPYKVIYGKHHKFQTYSEPHLKRLKEMGFNKAITVVEECRTVGDHCEISKYHTRPKNHEIDDMKQGDDLK